MTPEDRQHVINKLQKVIDDTQATLSRFEATGMDDEMREDYDKLLAILDLLWPIRKIVILQITKLAANF